jgi:hypothetical protein
MRQRRLKAVDLSVYPWVAPLPGSPLLATSFDPAGDRGVRAQHPLFGRIAHERGQLHGGMRRAAHLPHSVVFAQRREARIGVVPFEIPLPSRSLGILRHLKPPRSPAADRLAEHIVASFEELKHLVKRHENAVVWRR